jgi:hypothetical protein
MVRAPRCLLRTDSHCKDPGACLSVAACVDHIKVRQQLAGFKRKPVPGGPLRSQKR